MPESEFLVLIRRLESAVTELNAVDITQLDGGQLLNLLEQRASLRQKMDLVSAKLRADIERRGLDYDAIIADVEP